MKEYPCKKEKCSGTVQFPERNDPRQAESSSDQAFVILQEPLAECDVCKTAYFESEVANEHNR
jgi:hypothetical protein